MGDTGDPMAAPCFCLYITPLYVKEVVFRNILSSPMILSRDREVRSWSFGSSSNLMRTALMASGSGMLVNSAETSYAISFCSGSTSRFLTLSTESPLFWMRCSELPTRRQKVAANTL